VRSGPLLCNYAVLKYKEPDVDKDLNRIDVITLFVDDLQATRDFYQKVFDLPVAYEDENSAVFEFANMIVNLLTSGAAHELIEPATVAGYESGARFQFTIRVGDVDAVCEKLADLGVALLNGPLDRPWGIRTASFTDPGGHIWEVAT
jgi:lactoylglutathione lyase